MTYQDRAAPWVQARVSGPVPLVDDGTQWSALLAVRDAKTGEIIAMTRTGDTVIATEAKELELEASSGVHTTRQRVQLIPMTEGSR